MKILVISANYPPYHLGGYGLRIKDITDGLEQRGHEVCVLTTKKTRIDRADRKATNYTVFRRLHNRYNAKFFPKEVLFDLSDIQFIDQQIKAYHPDIIYLGHIYVLTKALIPYLAKIDIPIVLDEGGASLKGAWTERGRWFRFTGDYGDQNPLIRLIKPLIISLIYKISKGHINREWRWPKDMHVIINSQYNLEHLRELGLPLENAQVIYSGIDLDQFSFISKSKLNQHLKILCPGRIEKRKGILDSIALVNALKKAGICSRLILVGVISADQFYQEVLNYIEDLQIKEQVTILNMLPQKKLIDWYHNSDICFFPSYQDSGFSRTPLEAMACGCIVISYGNEGSDEVIRHGKNGFVVKEKDIDSVLKFIQDLLNNPLLVRHIATSARNEIEENFTLPRYVNQIEKVLRSTAQN
jgi:glycosyltransferase involved in cell wall biosynthesis